MLNSPHQRSLLAFELLPPWLVRVRSGCLAPDPARPVSDIGHFVFNVGRFIANCTSSPFSRHRRQQHTDPNSYPDTCKQRCRVRPVSRST